MFIQPKTQLQINLENLENYNRQVSNFVPYLIQILNQSYDALWSLPDAELTEVLQWMVDNNKLQEVFTKHYVTGTSLNGIASAIGVSNDAIVVQGREFTVSEVGVVTVVPLVIEDPINI